MKYLIEVVSLDDTSLILDAKITEEKNYIDACDEGCDFCDDYAASHGRDFTAVDYYVFAETDSIYQRELEAAKNVMTSQVF